MNVICHHFFRMRALPPLLLAAAVCFGGCRKKEETEPKAAARPEKLSVESPEYSTTAPPPPATGAEAQLTGNPGEQPNAATPAEQEAFDVVFPRLNMFSGEYFIEHKRALKSLDELVALGRIASIPKPPGGKVYKIDPRDGHISLENK